MDIECVLFTIECVPTCRPFGFLDGYQVETHCDDEELTKKKKATTDSNKYRVLYDKSLPAML